jgi:hypothetical protein
MSSALPLRFFKDSVYGAVATLIFSLLGRVEKYVLAAHLLSLPCMVLAQRPDTGDWPAWAELGSALACAYCSAFLAAADAVAILMLSCSLGACCVAGSATAPFSLGLHVCGGTDRAWDSQSMASAAIVTLGLGCLQSVGRARASAAGSRVYLAPASFVLVKGFQLSWWFTGGWPSFLVGMVWAGGALVSFLTFGASLVSVAFARVLCVALLLTESATLALLFLFSFDVPIPAVATVQAVATLLSAIIVWRAFFYVEGSSAAKKKEEKSTPLGSWVGRRAVKI